MSENTVEDIAALVGTHLGDRTVSYDDRDVILYALAVGAGRDDLDLIFEDRLRTLPTFGLTLAQWAPDILAERGVFDNLSVHGSQTLEVHKALPAQGELTLSAKVGNVWDKGSAAIFEVVVECDYYTATWSIFAPGKGGFGGDRGAKATPLEVPADAAELALPTFETQAALYRLTGDRHHIHIDPEASAKIGQPVPILQGLATIAGATLPLAREFGAHPADLSYLAGRFSGPVVPGETLTLRHWGNEHFEVFSHGAPAISAGEVKFS